MNTASACVRTVALAVLLLVNTYAPSYRRNMSGRSVKAEGVGRVRASQASCVVSNVSLQEQELSGQLGDLF